jgi:hypothetical protein
MNYRVVLLASLTAVLWAQGGTEPKTKAAEYPLHADAGKVSLGAEYTIHSFSGGHQTFVARDYLVVEVALFFARGERLMVNDGQFSLRINHKKDVLAPQAPEFVAASLKYPDWGNHPSVQAGVGPIILGAPPQVGRFPGDPAGNPGPTQPRAPTDDPSGMGKEPQERAEDLVVRVALPEGEARVPVSGYLYFAYQGKTSRIRSLDLEYSGPGGSVTLPLL